MYILVSVVKVFSYLKDQKIKDRLETSVGDEVGCCHPWVELLRSLG